MVDRTGFHFEGFLISVLANIALSLALTILLAVVSCLAYKCYSQRKLIKYYESAAPDSHTNTETENQTSRPSLGRIRLKEIKDETEDGTKVDGVSVESTVGPGKSPHDATTTQGSSNDSPSNDAHQGGGGETTYIDLTTGTAQPSESFTADKDRPPTGYSVPRPVQNQKPENGQNNCPLSSEYSMISAQHLESSQDGELCYDKLASLVTSFIQEAPLSSVDATLATEGIQSSSLSHDIKDTHTGGRKHRMRSPPKDPPPLPPLLVDDKSDATYINTPSVQMDVALSSGSGEQKADDDNATYINVPSSHVELASGSKDEKSAGVGDDMYVNVPSLQIDLNTDTKENKVDDSTKRS